MRRTLVLVAVLGGMLTVPVLATSAVADEGPVSGCLALDASTPPQTVTVGPVTVHAPSISDVSACAFDSASVTADTDPIQESTSCAYGPSIVIDGATASIDPTVTVTSTADGEPFIGTTYDPGLGVDYTGPGYDSGPLWMIPC